MGLMGGEKARSRDLVVGEASSTLPLGEEEPQRASYAAADGVVARGLDLRVVYTTHARVRVCECSGAQGGGTLLRMCGEGRVNTI